MTVFAEISNNMIKMKNAMDIANTGRINRISLFQNVLSKERLNIWYCKFNNIFKYNEYTIV